MAVILSFGATIMCALQICADVPRASSRSTRARPGSDGRPEGHGRPRERKRQRERPLTHPRAARPVLGGSASPSRQKTRDEPARTRRAGVRPPRREAQPSPRRRRPVRGQGRHRARAWGEIARWRGGRRAHLLRDYKTRARARTAGRRKRRTRRADQGPRPLHGVEQRRLTPPRMARSPDRGGPAPARSRLGGAIQDLRSTTSMTTKTDETRSPTSTSATTAASRAPGPAPRAAKERPEEGPQVHAVRGEMIVNIPGKPVWEVHEAHSPQTLRGPQAPRRRR